ncbi:MAG TPA: DUF1572 family protein [Pirellulales bacterium]
MNHLLADIRHEFQRHQKLAEGALDQIDDESFFRRPSEVVNPIAIIVKHLNGNLLSRWTDFLSTDGDKPTRNRDGEFLIEPADTRQQLMARWQIAWATVFGTLDSLQETDLVKTVTIRGEPHTVQQALVRGLTHVAYHVGQIAYLARLWKPDGKWLTIAPGQSAAHQPGYRKN